MGKPQLSREGLLTSRSPLRGAVDMAKGAGRGAAQLPILCRGVGKPKLSSDQGVRGADQLIPAARGCRYGKGDKELGGAAQLPTLCRGVGKPKLPREGMLTSSSPLYGAVDMAEKGTWRGADQLPTLCRAGCGETNAVELGDAD